MIMMMSNDTSASDNMNADPMRNSTQSSIRSHTEVNRSFEQQFQLIYCAFAIVNLCHHEMLQLHLIMRLMIMMRERFSCSLPLRIHVPEETDIPAEVYAWLKAEVRLDAADDKRGV